MVSLDQIGSVILEKSKMKMSKVYNNIHESCFLVSSRKVRKDEPCMKHVSGGRLHDIAIDVSFHRYMTKNNTTLKKKKSIMTWREVECSVTNNDKNRLRSVSSGQQQIPNCNGG